MTIIVTGAAGFVGSNLVAALNQLGERSIIAVDDLSDADKFKNLVDTEIEDYLDKDDFIDRVESGFSGKGITAILHQGACSDTMETDGRFMMDNNFRYSRVLLGWAQQHRIPFLYASSAAVYGASASFREERGCEAPLNIYGYSKFLFDQTVRPLLAGAPRAAGRLTAPIVGFRYFNVYGMREQHKGRMASVAFHHFNQYHAEGRVKLFAGHDGWKAGHQRRDRGKFGRLAIVLAGGGCLGRRDVQDRVVKLVRMDQDRSDRTRDEEGDAGDQQRGNGLVEFHTVHAAHGPWRRAVGTPCRTRPCDGGTIGKRLRPFKPPAGQKRQVRAIGCAWVTGAVADPDHDRGALTRPASARQLRQTALGGPCASRSTARERSAVTWRCGCIAAAPRSR